MAISISHKHIKFWKIALRSAKEALEIASNIKSVDKVNKIKWKWLQQRRLKSLIKKYERCSELIDVIIAMCAFTLESFINFYAIHFGLDSLPGYNEMLNSKEKWKKYPQQRVNKTLSNDLLDKIQKVMNARNRIAHYKPSTSSETYKGFTLKDALDNINEVSQIFIAFSKIDDKIKMPEIVLEIPNYAKNIALEYYVHCDKSWKKSS